jgi:hypothetical protein
MIILSGKILQGLLELYFNSTCSKHPGGKIHLQSFPSVTFQSSIPSHLGHPQRQTRRAALIQARKFRPFARPVQEPMGDEQPRFFETDVDAISNINHRLDRLET